MSPTPTQPDLPEDSYAFQLSEPTIRLPRTIRLVRLIHPYLCYLQFLFCRLLFNRR